ncbi:hypothetical protein ACVIHI_002239 [Bradyrhizobium sp. USDA 4524]|nr:hypothetical protein [Bradyrhizobium sp. USDA 4538]MCP1905404.1 hypothetical protein [Bradyrhizobium sp. USDA 4537]MCP1988940.1 hypothetical protein [Bradyrhizobium sp. USDA 4539]
MMGFAALYPSYATLLTAEAIVQQWTACTISE